MDQDQSMGRLTSDTGEKLPGKALYLAARKGHKTIALQKIEDALSKQIRDNANVVAKVKAVSKMYTLVSVLSVII